MAAKKTNKDGMRYPSIDKLLEKKTWIQDGE